MKSKLPLVLLIVLLIVTNLYFEFKRGDYSNDPDDKKIAKISTNYEKETNDYNFQIINDIFLNVVTYANDRNETAINSIFDKQNSSSLNNINNYSIQEIYRLPLENVTINFIKIYVEQNDKLNTLYFQINQDITNETYNISVSSEKEYTNAKNNNVNIDTNFTINANDFNKYEYDYDFTKIAYRYINDYYLKYTYLPKEAYEIDNNYRSYNQYMQNRIKLLQFDSDLVIDEWKSLEKDSIIYFVQTNSNSFEIKVSSPMNYKIKIE